MESAVEGVMEGTVILSTDGDSGVDRECSFLSPTVAMQMVFVVDDSQSVFAWNNYKEKNHSVL